MEFHLSEARSGLENEIPVRIFKQEKKLMIYVFSSSHSHRADADLHGNHAGKPQSEMSSVSSLFSVSPFGCKTHRDENFMLVYSAMYSQVLL